MTLQRCVVLALIVLGVTLVTARVVEQHGPPAFRTIFDALSYASFVVFSVALAAGYTGLRGVVVVLAVITVLSMIPSPMATLARGLAPLGVGILLGVAARRFVSESTDRGGS